MPSYTTHNVGETVERSKTENNVWERAFFQKKNLLEFSINLRTRVTKYSYYTRCFGQQSNNPLSAYGYKYVKDYLHDCFLRKNCSILSFTCVKVESSVARLKNNTSDDNFSVILYVSFIDFCLFHQGFNIACYRTEENIKNMNLPRRALCLIS